MTLSPRDRTLKGMTTLTADELRRKRYLMAILLANNSGGGPPTTASASPSSVNLTIDEGELGDLDITVTTSDASTPTFTTSTDQPWLSVTPSSGTLPVSLRVRANAASLTDGSYSGNVTISSTGIDDLVVPVAVIVEAPPVVTEQTLWAPATVPDTIDSADSGAYELGTVFQSTVDGEALGVRFYKAAANTGVHTGRVWDRVGNELATVTFTGETADGWQEARFSTPVPITAGDWYTVSYSCPNGHYSFTANALNTPLVSGPLVAESGGYVAANHPNADGNAVYSTSPGSFPTTASGTPTYFADVVFAAPD